MFMNLAAFKSTIRQKLNFQFQGIVDADAKSQKWIEMLYRPQHMLGYQNVDLFFKSLTTQQKVDLDIQIFNQLPQVLKTKKPNRLSVNLMPLSLLSNEFRNNLTDLLDHQLINPQNICIEIIEIHSMPSLCNSAIDLLKRFRSEGGWIALDDFGSGFAHWELLQIGLIDVLKVANQNLSKNHETTSFTRGLAEFAQSMGISTVLEGVETITDFEKGKKQGYQNFQGWYFDKGSVA